MLALIHLLLFLPLATALQKDKSDEPFFLSPRQDITEAPTPTSISSSSPDEATGTDLANLPEISAPSMIGLIMPNPSSNIYAGISYTFGFIDPSPGPPQPQNGILRQVLPLLTFPNCTTYAFTPYSTLSLDPADHVNDTQLEDTKGAGWCSVDLAPRVRTFEFLFPEVDKGFYRFVINTTWARPTITGPDPSQNCSLPYLALYSFFASETFKIATPPTGQLPPPPPAYTVYKQLDWRVPGDLPVEQADSTSSKKMIASLAAIGAVAVIGAMATFIWLERRKKKGEQEVIAVSRLPPEEQAQFLAPGYTPNYLPPVHPQYGPDMRYAGGYPVAGCGPPGYGQGQGGGEMQQIGWKGAWSRAMGRRTYRS